MVKNNKSQLKAWIGHIVGARIKAARERHVPKLNQMQLAQAVEVNRVSLTKIEAGLQAVSLDTLFRIAKKLKIEPSTLLPSLNEFENALNSNYDILQAAQSPEGLSASEINSILKSISKK